MIKGKKIIVMFMMLGLGTASLVGCGKKENTADAKGDSAAASGQMVEGQMNYELTTTDNNRLADDGSSAVDNNDQQNNQTNQLLTAQVVSFPIQKLSDTKELHT